MLAGNVACYLLNNESNFEHCNFIIEKVQFRKGMWSAIISTKKAILNIVFLLKKKQFQWKMWPAIFSLTHEGNFYIVFLL